MRNVGKGCDRFGFVFDEDGAAVVGPGVEGLDHEVFDVRHLFLEQVHAHDGAHHIPAQPLPVLALQVQAIEASQQQGEAGRVVRHE